MPAQLLCGPLGLGWWALPLLLSLDVLLLQCLPSNAVLFIDVECADIDPNRLTGAGVDLMRLDKPLVLRNCQQSDSMLAAISALMGSPETLKRHFGRIEIAVYGTGPFQLQLGSSIIPIPKSGSVTMETAVDRLASGAFAFGTQRGNPSSEILPKAKELLSKEHDRSAPPAAKGDLLYENYFGKFATNIFSMSAMDAGAPFHHHSTAWLYLAAGVKRWFAAPWAYPLKKELLFCNPKDFLADPNIFQVSPSVGLCRDANQKCAASRSTYMFPL
jgi:hypothetical protein